MGKVYLQRSLAAWMRYKYPHLVFAAVSTSGPLLAKTDFPEYFETVTKSLAAAGNKECERTIRKANEMIDDMVHTDQGRADLRKLFNLCEPLEDTKLHISTLSADLAETVAGVVQYNMISFFEDFGTAVNIKSVCEKVTNKSINSPLKRYAEGIKFITGYTESCLQVNYTADIELLRITEKYEDLILRQWFYQTCTEFGFYQSSSRRGSTFGDKIPVEYFTNMCTDVFGAKFSMKFIDRSVEETNIVYGALSLPIDRIIFVHGSIDPWSSIGITRKPHPGSVAIFIKGTAHCANMMPQLKRDPPSLVKARKRVTRILDRWINKKHISLEDTYIHIDSETNADFDHDLIESSLE